MIRLNQKVKSKNKPTTTLGEKKERTEKHKRLSAALRDNLRKRKTQKPQRSNANLET